jgi:hypothetical protein
MSGLARLDDHEGIALDLDATLIGHYNSDVLQRYVVEHHHSKRFWIVTFRGDSWADEVWEDLEKFGGPAKRDMFRGLRACPARLLNVLYAWYVDSSRADPNEVFRWKGSVAKELNCTVLVDDRPEWVLPGCRENGVELIDTNDL